jgi:hypothetical protein
VTQNATLHDLTERLASHSRMNPFMSMGMSMGMGMGSYTPFPPGYSSQQIAAAAAAANAIRQPAPPPQLPNCPIYTRHQDQGLQNVPKTPDGVILGDGKLRCPKEKIWGGPEDHEARRSAALTEGEMAQFIEDMATVMRREYDSFVEQCW